MANVAGWQLGRLDADEIVSISIDFKETEKDLFVPGDRLTFEVNGKEVHGKVISVAASGNVLVDCDDG